MSASGAWWRVLVTVLGISEVLMVAAGPTPVLVVGSVGAVALVSGAWWRSAPRPVTAGLVVLGTAPLAVLEWSAVVPPLFAAVTWVVALPIVVAPPVRTATRRELS